MQIIPSEVVLHPGQKQSFKVSVLDKGGNVIKKASNLKWEKYVPATAKVKAEMNASFDENGVLVQLCVSSIGDLTAANDAATAASQEGAGEVEQAALVPYKDLMIRVAGYSAYFVTLSPQMRQEIIDRANFGMADGIKQHAANDHAVNNHAVNN